MNWTNKPPKEPGLYLWKATGSISIVRIPKDLSIGIVVQGCDFYNRCSLDKWIGKWFGPIPKDEE